MHSFEAMLSFLNYVDSPFENNILKFLNYYSKTQKYTVGNAEPSPESKLRLKDQILSSKYLPHSLPSKQEEKKAKNVEKIVKMDCKEQF